MSLFTIDPSFKIVTNDLLCAPHPKMMLSLLVPVTDEFRQEIDKWMIEFFGMTEEKIFSMNDPFDGKNTLVMSSRRTYELRNQGVIA